jgi:hypothetical protein
MAIHSRSNGHKRISQSKASMLTKCAIYFSFEDSIIIHDFVSNDRRLSEKYEVAQLRLQNWIGKKEMNTWMNTWMKHIDTWMNTWMNTWIQHMDTVIWDTHWGHAH